MTSGLSEEKVHAPGDVEVGGVSVKSGSLTTFSMSPHASSAGVPTTVSTIDTGVEGPYEPAADCVAVIVVVPAFRSMSVEPLIVATVGSDEANVHEPDEFDDGGKRVRIFDEVGEMVTDRSAKDPIVGEAAKTVRVIEVLADP
jgi:hypothetical protein